MKANSTVADGFDILNETILNIRNNTLRETSSQFTMSQRVKSMDTLDIITHH